MVSFNAKTHSQIEIRTNMQKNYLKLLLLMVCLVSASGINAQTYTHGHITAVTFPSLNHDSTMCHSTGNVIYNITIDTSYVGDSVKVVDTISHSLIGAYGNTTGASPWTFSAPVFFYNPVITDDQVAGPGVVFNGPVIKITYNADTINGIPNIFFLAVPNPCIYGTVSGTVYIDKNTNCLFDAGDTALNGIIVTSNANLSSPSAPSISEWNYTGSAGTYSITVQKSWMTNYTVSLPPDYAFIFPISPCFSGSYTCTTLPQTGVDFPLECTSNIDVYCFAESPADVRVNTPFFMQPFVGNVGCDTASGQMKLVKDSRVIYDPSLSLYPASSVAGDTLIWNYTDLTNVSGGAYWNYMLPSIHLTPDTTVVVGDTLCFRVYTNILPADINPWDNDYTICLPVVYSYDPNLKEVSPQGTGPQGYIPATTDSLTYTVHFQNTGSSYAINVSIIDTLDSHISPNSVKILGTSKTMTPVWLAPNIVQFNYNSIYLPDSTDNEAASHGYVRFMVKLNSGLPAGTQIKNTADIYFDTNPAVVTNTTLNTIQAPVTTGLPTASIAPVKLYPNPATDYVVVEHLQNGKIQIEDINGSVVIEQDVTDSKTTIDINRLPNGIYVAKFISKNGVTIKKFIKY